MKDFVAELYIFSNVSTSYGYSQNTLTMQKINTIEYAIHFNENLIKKDI
tara:strand:- start:115 stop:261 length:147 start_codon:yes stop_codon:yes gene_type:complete